MKYLIWLLITNYDREKTDNKHNRTSSEDSLPDTCNVSEIVEGSAVKKQKPAVPVWSANNSLLAFPGSTSYEIDKVYAIPLINYPAHEWKTLTTSLLQLHKLKPLVTEPENRKPLCVRMDIDLYKRALKL